MADITTYDARVAARTRCAEQILRTQDLLDLYEEQGGLADDLTELRDLGRKAEALSQARSGAKAAGGGVVLEVAEQFTALQKEYAAVMAVVQAVRRDLTRDGAGSEVLAALDGIIADETAVLLLPGKPADGAAADGKRPKRRAVRSQSQEAVRAEIHKDAAALLALKEAQAALTRRKVPVARLKKLRDDAEALIGSLGERAAKKGAGKAATEALHETVRQQKELWRACYRLLSAVGQQDPRVRALLADAARKR